MLRFTARNYARIAKAAVTRSVPVYAHWGITHRCDITCRMCGIWKHGNEDEELSLAEVSRLADVLRDEQVDVDGLSFSSEARTMLAFVSLRADGERSFMFYRHPSADMLFTPREVDMDAISRAKLLHFGSISLIGEPSRSVSGAPVTV